MPESEEPLAEPRLERTIRAALAADRDEHGAPPALRTRVDAIPADAPASMLAGLARWPGLGIAAIAGLGAAFVLSFAFRLVVPSGLGQVGAPGASTAPATFDPSVDAQGILHDVPATLQWIPAAVALAAGGTAVYVALQWFRQVDRRRRSAALGVALAALAAGSVALTQEPGFEWQGGSSGPVVGFDVVRPPGPGSANVMTYYDTAPPGGTVAMVVDVTNPGPLTIRLEGLVQRVPDGDGLLRWTALALGSDPHLVPNDVRSLLPFHPTDVPPNGYVTLYLIGKAGRCAYGPTLSLDNLANGSGGYQAQTPDRQIELAYSVFGLERTGLLTLPFEVVEVQAPTCVR